MGEFVIAKALVVSWGEERVVGGPAMQRRFSAGDQPTGVVEYVVTIALVAVAVVSGVLLVDHPAQRRLDSPRGGSPHFGPLGTDRGPDWNAAR